MQLPADRSDRLGPLAPQPWKLRQLGRWGQLDQEQSMQLRVDPWAPEL